jgi:hypothetical protein
MRHQDWPIRLARFCRAHRETPFRWGTNDCVTLVADWILEATGEDLIADLRGWHDATSAMKLLAAEGGIREAIGKRLGEEIDWRIAQRGDIVLFQAFGRLGPAICVGPHAVVSAEHGAIMLPIDRALCAWRV